MADLFNRVNFSPGMVRYKALHITESTPAFTNGAVPVGAPEAGIDGYLPQGPAEHLSEVGGQGAVEKGALTLFSSSVSHLRSFKHTQLSASLLRF
jgi:hypothetical protein